MLMRRSAARRGAGVLGVTAGPTGAVAVRGPMFSYWPATAVPLSVNVKLAAGASEVPGQVTTTPLLSVTVTPVSATLPLFVTRYVQATGVPTRSVGPGAVSLSVPLVRLTMLMR